MLRAARLGGRRVLSLPGRTLALGSNLRDPVPEALREPRSAELAGLLARREPVPPAADDCGASDRSVLDQRMHHIAHLFRCFHDDAPLAGASFTHEQAEAIRRGRIPDGEL